MNDATDLRSIAESIAARIPPDIAHVPNAHLSDVTRDEIDRWLEWDDCASAELVAAAGGDEHALRSEVCAIPEVGVRPHADELLLGAAIKIGIEQRRATESTQEQAMRLARMNLRGIPAAPGAFRPEAVALACEPFMLRAAARDL